VGEPRASGTSDVEAWILENRRSYEVGFGMAEGKTQLAVSIPIEEPLRSLLAEARQDVVNSLFLLSGMHSPHEAKDIRVSPIWVPDMAHIPAKDMHITVCIPSLWRVPDNDAAVHAAYNESVANAMATAAEEHEAFVLEVDRISLGKDGSLIVLFRTVGIDDEKPDVLKDRGSEALDPMTSLRSDVLYVFLEKNLANVQRERPAEMAEVHNSQSKLLRQATIVKTVGGSAHGYVHCSLSRLAIGPSLTKTQIDISLIHFVCRSWTAKLAGRRMAVRGFKVTEMTALGAGGNKNPFDQARWSKWIELRDNEILSPKKPRQKSSRTSCYCFPWCR